MLHETCVLPAHAMSASIGSCVWCAAALSCRCLLDSFGMPTAVLLSLLCRCGSARRGCHMDSNVPVSPRGFPLLSGHPTAPWRFRTGRRLARQHSGLRFDPPGSSHLRCTTFRRLSHALAFLHGAGRLGTRGCDSLLGMRLLRVRSCYILCGMPESGCIPVVCGFVP